MHFKRFALLSPILLIAACTSVPRNLPAPSAANVKKWEPAISKFEKGDITNAPPRNGILFIGSSSIRRWDSLSADYPDHPVYNRGFGGSQIADSLHFADRIVLPYQPRQIVMFAGSNDINAGKTPEQVLADFIAFTKLVQKSHPKTQISWIAITPCEKRWDQFEQVTTANELVARYCRHHRRLDYINTIPQMLGENGRPRADIFVADQLHLNEKGYAVWTDIIRPYLR